MLQAFLSVIFRIVARCAVPLYLQSFLSITADFGIRDHFPYSGVVKLPTSMLNFRGAQFLQVSRKMQKKL